LEEYSVSEMLVSVYMGLQPRWPEHSVQLPLQLLQCQCFLTPLYRCIPMMSQTMLLLCCCTAVRALHLWPLQLKTEVKCNVTCYGVQTARTTLDSPKGMIMLLIPHFLLCISLLEVEDKKTAGRGISHLSKYTVSLFISHLSKYTVSLFILVPSSYVTLFNSSLVWRMYCRQCRCNNNGQTAQDSIAVVTSTVVINVTTTWQL
jgi:hypothetical protein